VVSDVAVVTGGAGFIGSHIADALLTKGFRVVILDNLSTGKRENIPSGAVFYEVEVQSPEVMDIFEKEGPRWVFHLAAQIDVRKSVLDPKWDAECNIIGTINVLEASSRVWCDKFVFTSSGGVIYGEARTPAPEDIPPFPICPYGISKWSGEEYVKFYGRERELSYTILRYANVYGPRQDPKGEAGVVAIFSYQLLRGEKSVLYGFGKMVRDYVYVGDVVSANLLAMERGDGEVINIGTGKGTTVEELFSLLENIVGVKGKPEFAPARPGELQSNMVDISKAKAVLGWEPEHSLKEGLRITVDWFREQLEG